MSIETIKAKVIGISPLIMHNGQLADPMNSHSKAMKQITSKRNKTDDEIEELRHLEWLGGLYLDENSKPAIPSDMVIANLVAGAKKAREGKNATVACFETKPWYPIIYNGPKTIAKLYEDASFVDCRSVRLKGPRVMRCRPRFNEWSIDWSVNVDTEMMNVDRVKTALEIAGRVAAYGDFRPRYGRFIVEWL